MEKDIENIVREKEKELLEKYFPNGITFSLCDPDPEHIGNYTKDLPLKIESEFRDFLADLWKDFSDQPLVLEEVNLRKNLTENLRDKVEEAYKDAERITLWERITNSNNEDVTFYKGLLYNYTKELLMIMRLDFLEEITGNHITGKTFEDS
ncbi:MAG: hypothetical protein J1E16_02290 [Muribaculaceae bacterium]|nr:hypothetical protein [Muribaculaceae bacterium]